MRIYQDGRDKIQSRNYVKLSITSQPIHSLTTLQSANGKFRPLRVKLTCVQCRRYIHRTCKNDYILSQRKCKLRGGWAYSPQVTVNRSIRSINRPVSALISSISERFNTLTSLSTWECPNPWWIGLNSWNIKYV